MPAWLANLNPAWLNGVAAWLALAISLGTLYLTRRSGQAKITRPTVVYFGPDAGSGRPPKIYIIATLYCTATRGRMLEHLYMKVSRRDAAQVFSIWVHGDKGDLGRGGGLFVPHDGVSTTHHFLCGDGAATFRFAAGDYTVELFGQYVGQNRPGLLWRHEALRIGAEHAKAIEAGAGLHFDWSSEAGEYESRLFDARSIPGSNLFPPALRALFAAPDDASPTTEQRDQAARLATAESRVAEIEAHYRRGAFFTAHLGGESHIDRDGTFTLRIVLHNSSPFRPLLGTVIARQVIIDGRAVSAGAIKFVIQAPHAEGDLWSEQPVYAVAEGRTKEPIPAGRGAVSFHLGGLQITPRDGLSEWPIAAKLGDVTGCLGVGEK